MLSFAFSMLPVAFIKSLWSKFWGSKQSSENVICMG
jgi:hypothetical protein